MENDARLVEQAGCSERLACGFDGIVRRADQECLAQLECSEIRDGMSAADECDRAVRRGLRSVENVMQEGIAGALPQATQRTSEFAATDDT